MDFVDPETASAIWDFVRKPVAATPWAFWEGRAWRDFWLLRVLDDRYVVVWFLPLVPLLMCLSRQGLRAGIVVTGLAFLAFLFGPLYALFWLAMAAAFYTLAERFAVECRRTDVLPIGPPLAAGLLIGGGFLLTQTFEHIPVPPGWTTWLFEHAAWLYPYGWRGFEWEPYWASARPGAAGYRPMSLLTATFGDPHIIGTAYFTARMLHYFAEIRRGGIAAERRTRLNFFSYICYGPTLMQGPIERFNEFHAEMDTCHERRGLRNVAPALLRMGWGVAKSLISMWYFLPVLWYDLGIGHSDVYYRSPERIRSYGLLYFGVYIQIFALYLEFSGYCDITAGIARLLGYRQVENFRWPWLATSLRDFWRRWHISLSLLLRDYIYIALGGNRRHVTRNLCVTFAVCGLWHRPLIQLALWGIVMGLMLAVNQRWVRWMKRLDQTPSGVLPAVRRVVQRLRPLPQVVCWAITMHCFVMSLLIFFGGSGAIRVGWELVRRPLNALLNVELAPIGG